MTNLSIDDRRVLLSEDDLGTLESAPADARIFYGNDPLQFGDLRLPQGEGPHPIVVFIHGGMWLAEFDISHSGKLTDALAKQGLAVWSLEYRRVGNEGGGWPGTFQDINQGVDHLNVIAAEYNLDLSRVIVMGHSAGAHLSLWLAARSNLPEGTPVSTSAPLSIQGVLAMAAVADLESIRQLDFCQEVIDTLVGGSPEQCPEHYQWVDPLYLPPALPQVLLGGKYDDDWGPFGKTYFNAAKERGDNIRYIEAAECGHFDMIDPDSTTWPLVLETTLKLLDKCSN